MSTSTITLKLTVKDAEISRKEKVERTPEIDLLDKARFLDALRREEGEG